MMKTHYDTYESVSFQVKQSIITLYEAMSEQTVNL